MVAPSDFSEGSPQEKDVGRLGDGECFEVSCAIIPPMMMMDVSWIWPRLVRRACTCLTRIAGESGGLPPRGAYRSADKSCCPGLEINEGDAAICHAVGRSWRTHESIRSIQCPGGIPPRCPETSEETETLHLVGPRAARDWVSARKCSPMRPPSPMAGSCRNLQRGIRNLFARVFSHSALRPLSHF
jgi:hypothetical protein